MKKLRLCLLYICVFVVALGATAQVRFHNEETDTTRINEMLSQVAAQKLRGGDALLAFAQQFVGVPYVAKTLEWPEEMLTVNIDELDCTTLVETCVALAKTVDERRQSWRDFVYNLQNIRYRGGVVNGYPSRLHYIADWAVDNQHRGNFKDVTPNFDRVGYITRTIDFMSQHADKYPALADSANLAGVKNTEIGYRSFRFPYIKTTDVGNKVIKAEFRNGDVLAFVANMKDLDVSHMGILVMRDGEPYVLHASSSLGKVVVSTQPLAEFLKKNRQFMGVRVFRLQ